MDFLKALAPLIGTALGGPFGGIAASFIAGKLGLSDKTVNAVTDFLESGSMTPEQVAGIRLAEMDMQKFMADNALKLEDLSAKNTQGARDMQIATRSHIPGLLAIIITVGYLGILVGMMLGYLKVIDNQALLILVGALATGFGTVLNFFLGSSHGSQSKDAMLAQSMPPK
jgi:hypothetical protein